MFGRLPVSNLLALAAIAGAVLPAAGVFAGQIDTATFIALRRGMSQSEILVRTGKPDLVTSPGSTTRELVSGAVVPQANGNVAFNVLRRVDTPTVEEWHYVPDRSEHDPYLTVITFRRGEVWEFERTKIFTREHLLEPPPEPVDDRKERLSDDALRLERIERTLKAAEQYAATRARIKQRVAAAKNAAELAGIVAPKPRVYRHRQEDGSVYYGDSRPEPGNVMKTR